MFRLDLKVDVKMDAQEGRKNMGCKTIKYSRNLTN